MKNTKRNLKFAVSILTVIVVICAIPGGGYAFFDDLFGVIGDVVETIATVATTFVDVTVAVVDLAVGVVEVAVGVVDLTVNLALTLVGHTGCVLTTAFDPYGAILASGGCDYDVLLWDVLTGGITLTLRHVSAVLSLAYCARGRLCAGQWNGGRTAAPVDSEYRGTQDESDRAYWRRPEHGLQSFGSPSTRQWERGWDHPAMERGDRRTHTDPGRAYGQRVESRVPPGRRGAGQRGRGWDHPAMGP